MTTAMPLSTDADTAALWEVFLHRYGTRRSGAADALRAVIAADPGLAVARAAAALLAAFAGEAFDVEAEIAAARRGTKAHDWERSLVEATMTLTSQGMWPSRPSWERHHDRFPGDLLGLELVIFLTLMSTDPGARDGRPGARPADRGRGRRAPARCSASAG